MKITFIRIFIVVLFLTSNPSYSRIKSEVFEGITVVKSSQSCFLDKIEVYDSWIAHIKSANKDINIESFKKKYSRKSFNHFKKSFHCEFFNYKVDGLEIGGFLVMPHEVKNTPVIILNRGGTGTFGNIKFTSLFSHVFYLAKAGYTVIGSQYRGGLGQIESIGGKDEYGGQDVNDVNALFGIVDQLDNVDSKRIGMYGASRGSINMFLVAKESKRIKALVSASGIYDLEHELIFRPRMKRVYNDSIPDFQKNKINELKKRSVIEWAHELDLNAPILLLHSSYDKRASATGALNFALKLQALYFQYSLILFEADDHFFSEHQDEARQATLEWFKKYL